MSGTITTGKVRFSYLTVFQAREPQGGGAPKFSVTLLIPKSDVTTKQALDAAIAQTIQEALGTTFGGIQPPPANQPIHDGDGLRQSGEPYGPECKGCWVVNASTTQRPEVVDINCQPIIDQTQIYSGCYGRASLRFFAYNKAGKKGIGCGLGNIQKLADGEPLSGRTTAAEDFGVPTQQSYTAPVQQPYAAPQTTAIDPITGQPINMGQILGL